MTGPGSVGPPRFCRAGTTSACGECAWGEPCANPAEWSVRVTDNGGESWWAVCAEHAAALQREDDADDGGGQGADTAPPPARADPRGPSNTALRSVGVLEGRLLPAQEPRHRPHTEHGNRVNNSTHGVESHRPQRGPGSETADTAAVRRRCRQYCRHCLGAAVVGVSRGCRRRPAGKSTCSRLHHTDPQPSSVAANRDGLMLGTVRSCSRRN